MESKKFETIYHKYLHNECSEEELDWLHDYIINNNKSDILCDISGIDVSNSTMFQSQKDEIWKQIKSKISSQDNTKVLYRKVFVAASVLFLLSICSLLWNSKNIFEPILIAENNKSIVISTILEDSTLVYLKPHSKIYKTSDFTKTRDIELIGEAFFDAFSDTTRPFNVYTTNNIKITVLGTRFNVSTTADYNDIVLTEGCLMISNLFDQEIIKPGERVLVDKNHLYKEVVDTLKYNSWINNQLYFNNEDLETIVAELKSYYPDHHIQLNSSYAMLHFTGYLPTNDYDLCKMILSQTFNNKNIITN